MERNRLLTQYTQLFNARIADIRAQVNAMATSPATVTTLTSLDERRAEELGALLAEQHPYVLRVELLQRGAAEVDLKCRRAHFLCRFGPVATRRNQRFRRPRSEPELS